MNHRSRLRLHLKVLTTPNVAIDTMVTSMREVYSSVGIRVEHVSTETLNLAANPALQLLNTLDIGRCGGKPRRSSETCSRTETTSARTT